MFCLLSIKLHSPCSPKKYSIKTDDKEINVPAANSRCQHLSCHKGWHINITLSWITLEVKEKNSSWLSYKLELRLLSPRTLILSRHELKLALVIGLVIMLNGSSLVWIFSTATTPCEMMSSTKNNLMFMCLSVYDTWCSSLVVLYFDYTRELPSSDNTKHLSAPLSQILSLCGWKSDHWLNWSFPTYSTPKKSE